MNRVFKDIKSKTIQDEVYNVTLIFADDGEFILESSNCTCPWGSCWRWSKTNKTEMCKHLSQALEIYEEEVSIKLREENGIKN